MECEEVRIADWLQATDHPPRPLARPQYSACPPSLAVFNHWVVMCSLW